MPGDRLFVFVPTMLACGEEGGGRSAAREMNELTWLPNGRKRSAESSTRTLSVSDNVMADRTTAPFEKWNKHNSHCSVLDLVLHDSAVLESDTGDVLLATYLIRVVLQEYKM